MVCGPASSGSRIKVWAAFIGAPDRWVGSGRPTKVIPSWFSELQVAAWALCFGCSTCPEKREFTVFVLYLCAVLFLWSYSEVFDGELKCQFSEWAALWLATLLSYASGLEFLSILDLASLRHSPWPLGPPKRGRSYQNVQGAT